MESAGRRYTSPDRIRRMPTTEPVENDPATTPFRSDRATPGAALMTVLIRRKGIQRIKKAMTL
jgi:hypothetical protein